MPQGVEPSATKPCSALLLHSMSISAMGWLLNVVTGPVDYPAAVLIRAVDGIAGPGRLTRALGIDGTLNGQPANPSTGVWFSEGTQQGRKQVVRSARIGVDYAGAVWSSRLYWCKLDHN